MQFNKSSDTLAWIIAQSFSIGDLWKMDGL